MPQPQIVCFAGRFVVPAHAEGEEATVFLNIFPTRSYGFLRRQMPACVVKNVTFGVLCDKSRPGVLCRVVNESQEADMGGFLEPADGVDNVGEGTSEAGELGFGALERWQLYLQLQSGIYEELTIDYSVQFEIHPPA